MQSGYFYIYDPLCPKWLIVSVCADGLVVTMILILMPNFWAIENFDATMKRVNTLTAEEHVQIYRKWDVQYVVYPDAQRVKEKPTRFVEDE